MVTAICSTCPGCGAALETPLGCASCGALLPPTEALDAFSALGMAPSWELDGAELKKRLVRFSRLFHPDFHSNAGEEERAKAERCSAELNAAFEQLEDDYRRADLLIRRLGGPDQDAERQMPQSFLMEVLEWNETLEELRSAPSDQSPDAALTTLEEQLFEQRRSTMSALGQRLTPLPTAGSPSLAEARRDLNAVRYLDRALDTIQELRLERPTTR